MGELQDKVEGKVKNVTGAVTGDDSKQAEGKTQETWGNVQGKANDLKDKVSDAVGGDHGDTDHSH
ncbi:MAG: hypothetical protein NVSMB52_18850 [Chloroflexota bacterium]